MSRFSTIRKYLASLALGLALAIVAIPAAHAAFVQQASAVVNSQVASLSTAANPFPSNVTQGDTLTVIVELEQVSFNFADVTVTDTLGTVYTLQFTFTASSAVGLGVYSGVAPSTGANTITAASSAGTVVSAIAAREDSGLGAFTTAVGANISAPGTAANTITTGPISFAGTQEVIGFFQDTSDATSTAGPGTGFTGRPSFEWTPDVSVNTGAFEDAHLAGPATVAFTPASTGESQFDNFIVLGIVFSLPTPTIVQSTGAELSSGAGISGDAASLSLTSLPATGDAIIAVYTNPEPEGATLTGCVDNHSNSFTKIVQNVGSSGFIADTEMWQLASLPSGVTGTYTVTCTIAGTPGTTTAAMALMELNGSTGVDQFGSAVVSASPLSVSASAENISADDLVVVVSAFSGVADGLAVTGSFTNPIFVPAATPVAPSLGVWSGTTSSLETVSGGSTFTNSAQTSVGLIVSFKANAPFAPILLNSGANQIILGDGANTRTGDPVLTAFTKLAQDFTSLNTMTGQLFPARSVQTPVTGFSITPAQGVTELLLHPAGTLASGTINMPTNPGDNQPFTVITPQTITAITFTPASGQTLLGAPTTLSKSASWIYMAPLNTWFREE